MKQGDKYISLMLWLLIFPVLEVKLCTRIYVG